MYLEVSKCLCIYIYTNYQVILYTHTSPLVNEGEYNDGGGGRSLEGSPSGSKNNNINNVKKIK